MTSSSISTEQRFRRFGLNCPICGGHSGIKQGIGERCAGFLSRDGEYCYCTREQFSGKLELDESTEPPAFCHKLYGLCNCGQEHSPARSSPQSNGHKPKNSTEQRIIAEYDYHDEHKKRIYQTVRYEPKDFKQRRPDGKGGWTWNLQGITRLPYRLPELQQAPHDATIYVCEGEKAAEAARKLGLIATTNVCGAGKWTEGLNKYFKGRNVAILPDNDEKGRAHAQDVAKNLAGIAAFVRIVELPNLPEKGDIVEWIAAGGTKEQLEAIYKPPKRKFTYASEVQPQPVDYQWEKRLAKGMLSLLVGDPGLGKGLLCATIAAETTNGSRLPDGKVHEPGGVIIMSPEDSYEHTIVPRLIAAGADLSKIILLSEVPDFDSEGKQYNRPVSFPEDASILEEAIIECKASVAIIDPVLAMVNGKYDTHKDQESRIALARVLDVAKHQNCAILGIFHLNKAQSGNVLYRSGASIAFIAMARIGLFLVPDPDNPENGRVLVNHKNNLAAKAASLCFTIEQTPDEIGYVQWNGASSYTEQELLNQSTPTDNPKSEQETGLIEILKKNSLAMTTAEIHEKLPTGQSLNALEQMLKRKLEQGVLMRPSRGLYTYNGNPLYTAKTKIAEPDVSNVSNVSLQSFESHVSSSNIADSDMSVLEEPLQAASEDGLAKTDKTDMTFGQEIDVSLPQASMNGHQKRHETGSISLGKRIAMMQSQGILYPKKCKNPIHKGSTRWLPRENLDTNQWEWYCCQCEMEAQA